MRGLLSATQLRGDYCQPQFCDQHSLDLAFDADGHKAAALPVSLVDSSDALQQLFADAHLSDPHLSKPKQVGTFPQWHFLLQNNDHDNSTHNALQDNTNVYMFEVLLYVHRNHSPA